MPKPVNPKAIDVYRPFIGIGIGALRRLAPFLAFLLSPTAVADGTINAEQQRTLRQMAAWKDPRRPGVSERPVSESAVSGAGRVGKWLEAVSGYRPGYVTFEKKKLVRFIEGVDAITDALEFRGQDSFLAEQRRSVEEINLQAREVRAARRILDEYGREPWRALDDLNSPNKGVQALARHYVSRHFEELFPPERPVQPRPRPKPTPATPPAGKPVKPAPRPSPRPGAVPVRPPLVEPEWTFPPQLRPQILPDYWPELVVEARLGPEGAPQIRVRTRLARGRIPKRERDKKAARKGPQYLLHRLITRGWGGFTEVGDLWDSIRENLVTEDGSRVSAMGFVNHLEVFKAWARGELDLDVVGFLEDFTINTLEDAIIGRLNRAITERLVEFAPGLQDPLTTQQRRNAITRASRMLDLPF